MGFITPGINYIFDKKRKGRHNRAYNTSIYTNENRNFNRRYPNKLHTRYISEIKLVYENIRSILRHNDEINYEMLGILRSKLEKYIVLIHELEIFTKLNCPCPFSKQDAINSLKLLIKVEGTYLLRKTQASIDSFETPPLEAILDKQFNLMQGGCILFNKYLNKQLTIDLKPSQYYLQSTGYDFHGGTFKIEDDAKESILSELLNAKQIKLTDLPDEILIKIFSYSNNINNISLTCQHFNKFVLTHMDFISHHYIMTRYTHKYTLKLDSVSDSTISLNTSDENHHLNSHKLTIEGSSISKMPSYNSWQLINSDIRQDLNGDYTIKRYRDPNVLTIISSHAFQTPYMTYQIYSSLCVDHVIPASAWPDLEDKYRTELNNLNESNDGQNILTKLDKNIFKEFWNEFAISVPYLDPGNPGNTEFIKSGAYVDKLRIIIDLMISNTRFVTNIEDILIFLVSLMVKIEEDIVEENFSSIVPIALIRNYVIYYLRESINENEDGNEDEVRNLSDDDIWNRLKLKNPAFFILLKQSANEEVEGLLCPSFYGEHLKNDQNFWKGLKSRNEEELIEELIVENGISPETWILNMLAF